MDVVELQLGFEKYDLDGNGCINAQELRELCEELGFYMTQQELEVLLGELDADQSGVVERDEFFAWWRGTVGSKRTQEIGRKANEENQVDIFRACWDGDLPLLERFLSEDPTLCKARDENEFGDEFHCLHYASYAGHLDVIEYLVDRMGVDVNARTGSGCTALFFAAQQNHVQVVRFLLNKGARASIGEKKFGLIPYDVTDSEVIQTLVQEQCDVTVAPGPLDQAPSLHLERFGDIRVGWSYSELANRACAVSGFVVRVVNSRSGEVLLEHSVSGPDERKTSISGVCCADPVHVQVAACNKAGKSKYSSASEELVCCGAPSWGISHLDVNPVSRNSLKVEWKRAISNGARIDAYHLYISKFNHDDPDQEEWECIGRFPGSKLETTVEALTPGEYYRFYVIAVNAVGKSRPSHPSKPTRTAGGGNGPVDKGLRAKIKKTRAKIAFLHGIAPKDAP